ncbi:GGDEF domain-containing protein [Paenibacillus thalictri]
MRKRIQYEQELRNIKTKLEEAYKAKDEVIAELQALHRENEQKRQELIVLNGQLERLATTDTLTGLKNRRFFQERLAASIALFAEKASPCSLCIVDADHFKRINDTLGHDAGDRVLKQLAGIMQAGSREIDTVARFGGEEFVILLPGLEEQQVKAFAEKLRSAIELAPWSECAVTVSIGTATLTESDTDNTIITKADRALYASKAGGRNRVTHAAELKD